MSWEMQLNIWEAFVDVKALKMFLNDDLLEILKETDRH